MVGEDEELVSATIFEVMNAEFPNQTQLKKIKALLVYNITKDAKLAATFTMDLRQFPGKIYKGLPEDKARPNATINIEDEHFAALTLGELDPVSGFMQGKIKAKGDILLLQKLSGILKGARQALL
ncbi:hypothetical protein WR25_18602 [Diploscapter pachys]|uniref:SCP2 domain-containing protein n=1 Tax=Diploscapter pachys TaxID=2018661 RepID=A0A2A2LML6_9BILA|nr:hypothetical protein WR25_18602 [Diploscapter pachys]